MSFENAETYRRKQQTVHAARLTAQGNISLWNAGDAWIKRLREDGRLAWNGEQFFANPGTMRVQAAYPGDWLVLVDDTDTFGVVTDGMFRELYETYDTEDTDT